MNLADSAKGLEKVQKAQSTNVWKAQTPSDSSSLQTSPEIDNTKFPPPWLYVRSNLTSKIQIARASPSQVVKFATPGM